MPKHDEIRYRRLAEKLRERTARTDNASARADLVQRRKGDLLCRRLTA